MGTRHLTIIKDIDGEELACMYGQFDGYPSGHGKDLKKFLQGFRIINGYSTDEKDQKLANGMGCLAMQLIAYFKVGRHRRSGEEIRPHESSFHLCPPGTRDYGEDYIYVITLPITEKDFYKIEDLPQVPLNLLVKTVGFSGSANEDELKTIYSGSINDFDPTATMKLI